jgi:hypothetical protein
MPSNSTGTKIDVAMRAAQKRHPRTVLISGDVVILSESRDGACIR